MLSFFVIEDVYNGKEIISFFKRIDKIISTLSLKEVNTSFTIKIAVQNQFRKPIYENGVFIGYTKPHKDLLTRFLTKIRQNS
jgi:hypothetical protein